MTPEERFERIEKTLDRMTADNEVWRTESDERFGRIEHTLEEVAAISKRNETNLEILLNFMRDSGQRQEAMIERMSNAVTNLVRLFENHARDGHGGEV